MGEQLRKLDGQTFGSRKYDAKPPLWLKYFIFPFVVLTVLGGPLASATSPAVSMTLVAAVLAVYLVALFTWVRKHRV